MGRTAWSSLRRWQRVLIDLGLFVGILIFLLLPRGLAIPLFVSIIFSTLAVSFLSLRPVYQLALTLVVTAAMTSLLVATETNFPLLVLVAAIASLVLRGVRGWIDAPDVPDQKQTVQAVTPNVAEGEGFESPIGLHR